MSFWTLFLMFTKQNHHGTTIIIYAHITDTSYTFLYILLSVELYFFPIVLTQHKELHTINTFWMVDWFTCNMTNWRWREGSLSWSQTVTFRVVLGASYIVVRLAIGYHLQHLETYSGVFYLVVYVLYIGMDHQLTISCTWSCNSS